MVATTVAGSAVGSPVPDASGASVAGVSACASSVAVSSCAAAGIAAASASAETASVAVMRVMEILLGRQSSKGPGGDVDYVSGGPYLPRMVPRGPVLAPT